jgi:hypothetical protein
LSRPEEFIIKILKNESVIEKAKIMLTLIQNEENFDNLEASCQSWYKLMTTFVELEVPLFKQVASMAFNISLMMQPQSANKSKLPSGLDINRSLLTFFDKKSAVEKLNNASSKNTFPCVLYDVLLKELVKMRKSSSISGSDPKIHALDEVK